ncbi:hypothetical protein BGW80DRAFT_1459047 [Lactifluus volemus]|nr:hypothetical protein BGW80DRAFT_1459047 [Lactifluus volemus]
MLPRSYTPLPTTFANSPLPLSHHRMDVTGLGGIFVKVFTHSSPAPDVEDGEDGIDANVDPGSFYGTPPPLLAGSTVSFADFVSAPPPRPSRHTRGSFLPAAQLSLSHQSDA